FAQLMQSLRGRAAATVDGADKAVTCRQILEELSFLRRTEHQVSSDRHHVIESGMACDESCKFSQRYFEVMTQSARPGERWTSIGKWRNSLVPKVQIDEA